MKSETKRFLRLPFVAISIAYLVYAIPRLIYVTEMTWKFRDINPDSIEVVDGDEHYVLESVSPWKDGDVAMSLQEMVARVNNGKLAGARELQWLLLHQERIPQSWSWKSHRFPKDCDWTKVPNLAERSFGFMDWTVFTNSQGLCPSDPRCRIVRRR